MAKEEYTELIDYVMKSTGFSNHKVWRILKEYSKVLKDCIQRGNSIEIDGLISIGFTTSRGYIVNNKTIGLSEQIDMVCENLNAPPFEGKTVLTTYIRRIRDRIQEGYQVNIKGISYVIPQMGQDEDVVCMTRVSPVLKKPAVADFVISTDDGNLILRELFGHELRFKIEVSEDMNHPVRVADKDQKQVLKLEQVEL